MKNNSKDFTFRKLLNNAYANQGSISLPTIKNQDTKVTEKHDTKKKQQKRPWVFILFGLFLVILVFLSTTGFLSYKVYEKAKITQASAEALMAAFKSQNLVSVKSEMNNTKNSLNELMKAYNNLAWLKVFPYLGDYVKDGEHALRAGNRGLEAGDIMVAAMEPYADIIGFSNGSNNQGTETAKDRVDFIVKTIPVLIAKSDELSVKVGEIKQEIDQIDPNRYPEKINGKELRSKLVKGIDLVDMTADIVERGKPLLSASPYLLGVDNTRKYLVIFQNDKELRPTGGFLTAYSIAQVNKGKFEPVTSDDIYNLEASYKPSISAPDPLIKYLKGPYVLSRKFRLRDVNWSPDFSQSMKVFADESAKVGMKDIDGIIGVDTQLLVNLLNVIGPIEVPGYGKYSTEIEPKCNCPQVIYELESFADVEGPVVWDPNTGKIVFAPANMDNRKKIIGPLMNSILKFTLAQPKEKMSSLFEAAYNSLFEKHVMFYLFDQGKQKAIEDFGIAGRISDYDGDYLNIIDANLGGRKSNLYVTQDVQQEIKIDSSGKVEKIVTITYKNPEKYDGWLNSVLPNWVRIYVPKGSQLISFEGLEEKIDPYEELGKTVFAGFFQLRPQGVARVSVKYQLPFNVNKEYKMLIQKQPGKDAPLYTVSIGKMEDEFKLRTDKEMKYKL